MFIPVDRAARTPAYRQIEQSIRTLIRQGALRPGARLPSTRELAKDIGVNRITVSKALQGLETEGLISSEVGKGTYVKWTPTAALARGGRAVADEASAVQMWGPLFANPASAPRALPMPRPCQGPHAISFVSAAPPADVFPVEDFRRCVDYALKRRVREVCQIGAASGIPALKEYLVGWLAQQGIEASERTLIITTGCQQALDLTRKLLVHPNEAVTLENPTFPGAVGALSPSGTGLHEWPVHETGLDLRSLNLTGPRAKVIYTTPNFHNPTGQTMSHETRKGLADLALRHGVPIVEDDVFGTLRYEGPALPSLQSLCPNLVIYIASFSKMLSPGLRLGWMVAPGPVAEQIAMTKQASDLQTSTLNQVAMDEFCRRGLMVRHLKRMQRIFRRRRDAMAAALDRYLPSDARWRVPEGGLSMWVTLSGEFDTQSLLAAAEERGVQFLPGAAFYFRLAPRNSMRLSFATENEERITAGIKVLGDIITSRRPRLLHIGEWQERRAII